MYDVSQGRACAVGPAVGVLLCAGLCVTRSEYLEREGNCIPLLYSIFVSLFLNDE